MNVEKNKTKTRGSCHDIHFIQKYRKYKGHKKKESYICIEFLLISPNLEWTNHIAYIG